MFRTGTVAGWQSGDAAACKAVNAGSIPAPAFCIKFGLLLTIKKRVSLSIFVTGFVWEVCFENFNTNQKGGVGKSTISANLAHYFASTLNKRTTLVDFDTQASSSKWVRSIKPQRITVFKGTLPLSEGLTEY